MDERHAVLKDFTGAELRAEVERRAPQPASDRERVREISMQLDDFRDAVMTRLLLPANRKKGDRPGWLGQKAGVMSGLTLNAATRLDHLVIEGTWADVENQAADLAALALTVWDNARQERGAKLGAIATEVRTVPVCTRANCRVLGRHTHEGEAFVSAELLYKAHAAPSAPSDSPCSFVGRAELLERIRHLESEHRRTENLRVEARNELYAVCSERDLLRATLTGARDLNAYLQKELEDAARAQDLPKSPTLAAQDAVTRFRALVPELVRDLASLGEGGAARLVLDVLSALPLTLSLPRG